MTFGTTPWGADLIKTDQGYIGPVKDDETARYKYKLFSGISDWIYNQCRMIMQTEDRSPWAYRIFNLCVALLKVGVRWPADIQGQIPKDRQCKTRFCSLYFKLKFKFCKHVLKLHSGEYACKTRSWGDMTKDPYIAVFACAVFLDKTECIKGISIPYYLYRPQTWRWHRQLKGKKTRYSLEYDKWVKSKHEFVNVLREMRAWTILNQAI